MTKPTVFSFGQFLLQIGDGASPEVFSAPCGFTTKGFNQSASVQETTIPDCTDPDAAAYVGRGVDTLSGEISASGVLAGEAFSVYQDFFTGGVSKNCRIYPKGVSGGYYAGAFVLTAFNQTVQRGQKVNVDITLQSDGEYTWTAA